MKGKSILLALMLTLLGAGLAHGYVSGVKWSYKMTTEEKYLYLRGFCDGVFYSATEVRMFLNREKLLSDKKKADQFFNNFMGYFSEVDPDEIIKQVDEVYADTKNRPIPVINIMNYLLLKKAGAKEDKLKRLLEHYRAKSKEMMDKAREQRKKTGGLKQVPLSKGKTSSPEKKKTYSIPQ